MGFTLMDIKKIKTKLCRVCRVKYTPCRPLQSVCSPHCAYTHAKAVRVKTERKETREAKIKLKTKSDWLKETQTIVNRYCRLRDRDLGCVSCNKPPSWNGQWHASHFRSVGAAPQLRFNLWNINKSCSVCNNHLSSNHIEYLPRLIKKIGQYKVDWLMDKNDIRKYDIDYLIRLIKIFKKKIKIIESKI